MEYPPSPGELPRALLADARVCDALKRRDFTTVFAIAHSIGMSYNKLAEAVDISAERISQIAKGKRRVTSLEVIERIADGLRIPGERLGLAARPWEKAASSPSSLKERKDVEEDSEDPMKRRLLLCGALATGVTAPTAAALTAARRDLDSAFTDRSTPDLSYWESTVERYGYGYSGRAPGDVLADLLGDFLEMKPLLDTTQSVASRTRLSHVTGQMVGMAAIVLHDLGDHRESARWFHTAGRAAEESGDSVLHAWVLGREAMVPLNFGAPAVAQRVAGRARSLAGEKPTAAKALACAVAARAFAANGNREEALSAVAEAERVMEILPSDQSIDTWFGYPRQKHHVHLSQALTLLGETSRAYDQQQRALELSRRPSVMTRALISIDRATCLAHDGELPEAADVAAQAYGELPASYRSGLPRARAMSVYDRVRAVPEAERLRDALAVVT